jgi:UDP-3-O-[3-hydroxymyristoyl] glucosamine N-acyltransferase
MIDPAANFPPRAFVQFAPPLRVGHGSIVGDARWENAPITLGANTVIGRFCFVDQDVVAGDGLELDDHCGIYSGVRIGRCVKLVYGKKLYRNSRIGNHCIIGGHIPERGVLEDYVTFMGEIAHAHRNATLDWDTTDEPSPSIGEGSVIGLNSLLVGVNRIGKNCYVGAGEILRHDLEDDTVFLKGKKHHISKFRGFIQTRYASR